MQSKLKQQKNHVLAARIKIYQIIGSLPCCGLPHIAV